MSRTRAGAKAIAALAGAASIWAVGAGPSPAQAVRPAEAPPSVNFFGTPGLIDMPSAEMKPDGEVTVSYSYFGGQQRRNLTFQLLPRITGTLRYSTIENWRSRNNLQYDLYDRSFDVAFQLVREQGPFVPSIAIGLRDFLGTGVYSGEYVVASKRIAPSVTVTGGIGWGRLGTLGGFTNPFCDLFGGSVCERDIDIGEGGRLRRGAYFQGETAAPFGGVEWRTPVEGLSVKAEYSPDAYQREQREPLAPFERKSRLNFGAEYRVTPGITLGGYWMYGSEVGVNLAITANPRRPLQPQNLAPGPIPVTARPADAPTGGGWAGNPAARDQLGQALAAALDGEGLRLEEMRVAPDAVEVLVINRRLNQDPLAIGRATRVLQTGLPPSVATFRITVVRDGLPVTTVEIDRATYEGLIDRPDAGQRMWDEATVASAPPRGAAPEAAATWRREELFPALEWSVFPAPYLIYLTPDDPIRFGLNLDATATYRLTPEVSFSGGVSQPLIGRSSDPEPAKTELQPVRSESARYFAGYQPNLTRLTADYVSKIRADTYVRASGGYLERMFAGLSAEALWKPSEQNWGVGIELNYVAQRDNDGLGFGQYDYRVATGHASLYWDTGFYGFEVQVDAGRYLAGDWGSTLRLTRRFPNGWALGAFATVTDVSSEDFGEGSFDKGVTLEIPFRWATPFETRARNQLTIRSINRDGGARLDVANRLYPSVRELDRPRLERNWGAFWQ
jgi:hypothetical protein